MMRGLGCAGTRVPGAPRDHLERGLWLVVTWRSNPPPSAALSDPVPKESCMLDLLLSLPEANLLTFLFLLDHLKRAGPSSWAPCPGPPRRRSTRAGVCLQHSQGRGRSLPEDSSTAQPFHLSPGGGVETAPSASVLHRVAEKEAVDKTSLHNLATVFGPTLLRPSEKESKLTANPSQPITMTDSWSLEVMSQVWEDRLQPMPLRPDRSGLCLHHPESCPSSDLHRVWRSPRFKEKLHQVSMNGSVSGGPNHLLVLLVHPAGGLLPPRIFRPGGSCL
ncbi:Breakpoint cluster region protein [Plecturocebus cupreus]